MSSHRRFSAALIVIVAAVGLGACSNDPTGIRPVVTHPTAPIQPFGRCKPTGEPGLHGDTMIAARLDYSAARVRELEKVVSCANKY